MRHKILKYVYITKPSLPFPEGHDMYLGRAGQGRACDENVKMPTYFVTKY